MTPKIVLSAVTCGGRNELASKLAHRHELYGFEGFLGCRASANSLRECERRGGGVATSLHGPWWARNGRQYWLESGTRTQQLETRVWNAILGPIEENPTLAIARELNIPVVLHGGVVFELENLGKLNLLEGIHVRVENNDAPFSLFTPDNQDGFFVCMRAAKLLERNGIEASICLDIEHLAKTRGWNSGEDFIRNVLFPSLALIVSDNLPISAFHLCDYMPGGADVKGGGHRPFGEGDLPIQSIISYLRERFPQAEMVIEIAGSAMQYLALNVLGAGESRAKRVVRESVAFILGACRR